MPGSLEPVVRTVTLRATIEKAYEAWTRRIHIWWPVKRISASGEASAKVVMEGRVGGRLYESTESGEEHDWGRVVKWEPPTRLVFTWFLGADPDKSTEVDVRFSSEPDGTTKVVVTHGKWEHAAEDLAEMQRRCVDAQEGWTGILHDFASFVEQASREERSGRSNQ